MSDHCRGAEGTGPRFRDVARVALRAPAGVLSECVRVDHLQLAS